MPANPRNAPFDVASVPKNLERAVAEGWLTRLEDGRWALPEKPWSPNWMYVGDTSFCRFNMPFLFRGAYGSAQVPWSCRNCFKVKVRLESFRQLQAAYAIAKTLDAPAAKCGPTVDMATSADRYSMFVYLNGLDAARQMRAKVRAAADAHPQLGPDVQVIIKRGCTEFEIACGPSDRWTFPEGLAELEERLYATFAAPASPRPPKAASLACWIATAFRIGDETYLDATGGRRLYPAVVTYD